MEAITDWVQNVLGAEWFGGATDLLIGAATVSAAVGAWKAAAASARSSERLQRVEEIRLHRDLTPKFTYELVPSSNGASGGLLVIQLTGPDGLDQLDEVIVEVRDDQTYDFPPPLYTAEQAMEGANQVWGPWQLRPHIDHADEHGRRATVNGLPKDEPRKFALDRTRPPSWDTDDARWNAKYEGAPLRLRLTCRAEGHENWIVLGSASATGDDAVAGSGR